MQEPLILPYDGKLPIIDPSAWIAPGSVIIGNATIGPECSVWFGAVIRADINEIRIGKRTNIQDGVVCHVNFGEASLIIGDDVSIGHSVMLHGCRIESGCLIGIGARILDRVVVGEGSLVAAGSVVREGAKIPPGELWAGAPAVKKKELTVEDREGLLKNAAHYVNFRLEYMRNLKA
jgi:gamma-carbonic anhydrase